MAQEVVTMIENGLAIRYLSIVSMVEQTVAKCLIWVWNTYCAESGYDMLHYQDSV